MKKIDECTLAVQECFLFKDLPLNPSKSDVISLGTVAQRRASTGLGTVSIASSQLSFVDKIKSLLAHIDPDQLQQFDAQVNIVGRTCKLHICALRHICNSLPMDVAKTVTCSIAGFRLDYCNALLYGISDKNIQKLQRVLSNLARVVLKAAGQTPT